MRPRMRMTAKEMGTKKSVSRLIMISLSAFIPTSDPGVNMLHKIVD